MIRMLTPSRGPNVRIAISLCAALLCAVAAAGAVPAQASSASKPAGAGSNGDESIEALERLAEGKLRATHQAVRDQVEFQLTRLAKGGREARSARTKLVDYAAHVMADDRTVGAHLVDRLLETKDTRLRDQLRLVLVTAAPRIAGERKRILPKLVETARLADDRLPAVCDLLGALGAKDAAPGLIPLLTHDNAEVRTAVLNLVGTLRHVAAGPAVIKALDSKDDQVQVAAINAIRSLAYKPGIEHVEQRVEHAEGDVAVAAIRALREMRARSSVPTLLTALKRTNDIARKREILTAIGDIGPAARVADQARVEKELKKLLSRGGATARNAAWALAKLGATSSDVEKTLTRGYKEQAARSPKDLFNRLELARIYKRLGEHAGSKSFFTKAIKEYKFVLREDKRRKRHLETTCLGIAGCYARMGQFRNAANYLNRLDKKPVAKLAASEDFAEMRKDPSYRRLFPSDG